MTPTPIVLADRYELQNVIGRGGMAEVWRARDLRLGRDVAVKRLRADLATDPTFQTRFQREAQSAAGLNQPNIVSVYDTGSQEDPNTGVMQPYIVMELVSGHTLREILHEGRTIVPDKALEYTVGVLNALSFSHKHGIIHRDIKPANVMITPGGEVKVMDFGIARAVADTSATMTQTAAVIGTAQYLSPEQARGETVDSRSDIYSAGCLLYELLTGRPPFVGDSPVAVAYQHVREAPAAPSTLDPEITPDIDAITLKALAKDPADRYQSALEMREDIKRVLGGEAATALVPAVVPMPAAADATSVMAPTAARAEIATAPVDEVANATPNKKIRRISAPTAVLVGLLAILLVVMGVVLFRMNSDSNQAAATTTVPAVVGFTEDQAVSTIKNANLDPVVSHVAGNADSKGRVQSTDPGEGTSVPVSSQVSVVINDGPAATKVPDVLGRTEAIARQTLTSAGFTNITTQDASATQEGTEAAEGTIVAVNPSAGTTADPAANVIIYKATGRSEMPDVSSLGISADAATKLLNRAGFDNVEVVSVTKADCKADTVCGQTPPSGTSYSRSSTVTIQVGAATVSPSSSGSTTRPR